MLSRVAAFFWRVMSYIMHAWVMLCSGIVVVKGTCDVHCAKNAWLHLLCWYTYMHSTIVLNLLCWYTYMHWTIVLHLLCWYTYMHSTIVLNLFKNNYTCAFSIYTSHRLRCISRSCTGQLNLSHNRPISYTCHYQADHFHGNEQCNNLLFLSQNLC